METPRIKIEVIAEKNSKWVVNMAVLLHVKVTNIGYGPARRVTADELGGNIDAHPVQNFMELAINSCQNWDNVRIIPNSSGAGLLEFELEYEAYRTGDVLQTKFTHPIRVGRIELDAITSILKHGGTFHIEKFFSPGATHNEIEVANSQGIAIGDQAQITPNQTASKPSETNANPMDPVALVAYALISGLAAGLTDWRKPP